MGLLGKEVIVIFLSLLWWDSIPHSIFSIFSIFIYSKKNTWKCIGLRMYFVVRGGTYVYTNRTVCFILARFDGLLSHCRHLQFIVLSGCNSDYMDFVFTKTDKFNLMQLPPLQIHWIQIQLERTLRNYSAIAITSFQIFLSSICRNKHFPPNPHSKKSASFP